MPPELVFLPPWFPLNVYDWACWARQTVVPLTVVATLRPARPLPFGIDELRPALPPPFDPPAGLPASSTSSTSCCTATRATPSVRCAGWRCGGPPSGWWPARRPTGRGAASSRRGSTRSWRWTCSATRSTTRPSGPGSPAWSASSFGRTGRRGRCGGWRPASRRCGTPASPWSRCATRVRNPTTPTSCAPQTGCWRNEVNARGDWAVRRPELAPGGWAFEFDNDGYPDVDDTAEVVLALRRVAHPDARAGARGHRQGGRLDPRDAVAGRRLGGVRRRQHPGNDHKAAVLRLRGRHRPAVRRRHRARRGDARRRGAGRDSPECRRGVAWLLDAQEDDGSWFGRWGANHVYGTGAAVPALVAARAHRTTTRRSGGPSRGFWPTRTTTAAGARTCAPTTTPRGSGAARRPRRRRRGRCSRCWPQASGRRPSTAACGGSSRPNAPTGRWDEHALHRHRLPRRLLHQLPPVPARVPGFGARPLPREGRVNAAVVCTPLAVERSALGRALGQAPVLRTGRGPGCSAARLRRAVRERSTAGAGRRRLPAGSTRGWRRETSSSPPRCAGRTSTPVPVPSAAPLAAALRGLGLRVHTGPVVSAPPRRRAPRRSGCSRARWPSTRSRPGSPPPRQAARWPWSGRSSTPRRPRCGARAPPPAASPPLRALRRCRPGLRQWLAAAGPRTVALAAPRSFCAGVERAIDTVEEALRPPRRDRSTFAGRSCTTATSCASSNGAARSSCRRSTRSPAVR